MRVHSVGFIAVAAVSLAVSTAPAQAQNFFAGSAETIRDRYFRLTGAPVVMFGRDGAPDRTGGAFRLGYGITDAFDVEAKSAFFDGVTLIGGDGQFRVFADNDVLVSLRAGAHQAMMDNGPTRRRSTSAPEAERVGRPPRRALRGTEFLVRARSRPERQRLHARLRRPGRAFRLERPRRPAAGGRHRPERQQPALHHRRLRAAHADVRRVARSAALSLIVHEATIASE
jgi:hypothetical protein